MKPEEQVASIEVWKPLHELGVRFGAYFAHRKIRLDGAGWCVIENQWPIVDEDVELVEAPTVAELMAVMPDYVELIRKNEEGSAWWCSFDRAFLGDFSSAHDPIKWTWGDTASDAVAQMLHWLITEGHVTIDEINERGEAMKPNEPSVTTQSMMNAYLWFCDFHPDGKEKYPTYADWICSKDEGVRSFRQGWKCAWDSVREKMKETA